MSEEIPKKPTFKGIVEDCVQYENRNKKPYHRIKFKGEDTIFFLWKAEGFLPEDELEFEYEIKEFNGKPYNSITNFISTKTKSMPQNEQKKVIEIVNKPLEENITKLKFENDRLNREVALLKVSFDYGNRKNKEYSEILTDYEALRKIVGITQ